MIIYRCSACGRFFRAPSPLTLCKCRACGGWMACIDNKRHPTPYCVKKTKDYEATGHNTGLSIAKDICHMWETGSHLNPRVKYTERERMGKEDPLRTIIPQATPDIMNGLQHQQAVKNPFGPSQPQIEIQPQAGRQEKAEDVVQSKEEQQPDETSQNFRGMSIAKKLNSNVEQLRNLIKKCEKVENLIKEAEHAACKTTIRVEDPQALRWLRIFCTHPRILILGAQGTGKSCLAFWLLEMLHTRCRCFVYRLPQGGASCIPPWMGIIHDLNNAPLGCTVLVDEAYLSFFSRESQSKQNRELTRIMNLSRQKSLGLIFVAHEARHIDKNILSCIDSLVIKKPAPLQVELDRSFRRTYLVKAQNIFQGKSDTSYKSTSYICFSPSCFEGVLENPKPSFWSEKLSHIFASENVGREERPATELSKEEQRKRAKKLHDDYGYSYGEIAKDLGVGKTTAYRWLNENKGGGTKR